MYNNEQLDYIVSCPIFFYFYQNFFAVSLVGSERMSNFAVSYIFRYS